MLFGYIEEDISFNKPMIANSVAIGFNRYLLQFFSKQNKILFNYFKQNYLCNRLIREETVMSLISYLERANLGADNKKNTVRSTSFIFSFFQ